MNSTFLHWVVIILTIFCRMHCQVLDDDVFPLICPNGMQGKGFSWYVNNPPLKFYQSVRYSMCVQCQPDKGSYYDQIEMCLANIDDILKGIFQFDTISCDDLSCEHEFAHHPFCSTPKPFCGLNSSINSANLLDAIWTSKPIVCGNEDSNQITNSNRGYDINLVCPENSTFFGLERFTLPLKDKSSKPVLALLCKPTYLPNRLISVYAQGEKGDANMVKLFAVKPECPLGTEKADGTRCALNSNEKYKGLTWTIAAGMPSFQFLGVDADDKDKTNNEFDSTNDVNQPLLNQEEDNTQDFGINQNIFYIIIGISCCIALILIIAIIAQRMYIRKVRRNEEKSNEISKGESNYAEVSNPYYGTGAGPNSLETYEDFPANPCYESSQRDKTLNPEPDVYGDVTNSYYGRS